MSSSRRVANGDKKGPDLRVGSLFLFLFRSGLSKSRFKYAYGASVPRRSIRKQTKRALFAAFYGASSYFCDAKIGRRPSSARRYSGQNDVGRITVRRAATALTFEPDEAPVISNELLEANVVSIRADLTDFRAEFRAVIARIDHDIRAMAAKAESEIKTAVARFDEQFRDVRQDIRELRVEGKTLRDKLDATHTSLTAKIDGNCASLDKKIDATRDSLDKKIDDTRAALDKKIDTVHTALDRKIDTRCDELRTDIKDIRSDIKEIRADIKAMCGSIADLKGMQKAILWVLGVAGSLITIAGVGLGIAKTLHWI